jgi:2Fe-2S ferredoxin
MRFTWQFELADHHVTLWPHAEWRPQGQTIDVCKGASLREALLRNGVVTEGACEMMAVCAISHMLISGGLPTLPKADDDETNS